MKITILGAGAFGTTLGDILTSKGYIVSYYDPIREGISLESALENAEIMILAVPSQAVPDLLPHLPKNIPLIVATKGLLDTSCFDAFENYIIVSGPGFAKDIAAKNPTRLTATDKFAADLLRTDYLDFDITSDKRGVLLCGALKNVYAIAAGIRDLRPGTQEHGIFLEQATNEMAEVLRANGADPKTTQLACGRDDLKITCYYPSRNYEFGQKLRLDSNSVPEKTVEGVSALKRVQRGEILVPENAKILKALLKIGGAWA